jgi:hypothetical protein
MNGNGLRLERAELAAKVAQFFALATGKLGMSSRTSAPMWSSNGLPIPRGLFATSDDHVKV